jgi:hypothetical protein
MKRILTLVFTVFIVVGAFADDDRFHFGISPRIFGLAVGAQFALSEPAVADVETSVIGTLSGAYESSSYFRLPDGSLFTSGAGGYSSDDASINRIDLLWEVGIQQGILPGTDGVTDRAAAYALYRGQYDYPFADATSLFANSGLPEADGGLLGAMVLGLFYDGTSKQPVTHVQEGLFGDAAVEWAPEFLHNHVLGEADYARTTVTAGAFFPLFVAEQRDGMNRFASYLGVMGIVDWAHGTAIPFTVRSTTGGRSIRPATGGSVRGIETLRFDASLKAIANVDLRLNLPAIALPSIIPGIVIYTDLGYYNDLEMVSPQTDENSGVLVTSGIGVSIDMFDLVTLVFYTNFLWNETDIDGKSWVPFSLGFGYHF